MKSSTSHNTIRRNYFVPLAALPVLFLTSLAATAQTTTLNDDLVLKDRDLPANPENTNLFFAEDDPLAGSNALYSWQSEQGAWVWGYDTDWWSMFLNQNHVLKLYNTDTTTGSENAPSIILDPGDGALGMAPASITIYGSPVITQATSSSWLTHNLSNAGALEMLGGEANGVGSFATGNSTSASGANSFTAGYSTSASGDSSFAVGAYSNASGMWSSALSGGQASGFHSVSLSGSAADGEASFATSSYAWAVGNHSIAMGEFAHAFGDHSVAIGHSLSSTSHSSVAVGTGNENRHDSTDATTIAAAKSSWQGDDQHSIFEVGIGDGSTPKNALTILQDGSVEIGKATATDNSIPLHVKANGDVILAKAQGDISMGIYQ